MKYFICMIFLFSSIIALKSVAEASIANVSGLVNHNIIDIKVTKQGGDTETGKGIVVGRDNEGVYIVTADHVVRTPAASKKERFKFATIDALGIDNNNTVAVKLLDKHSLPCDVAVLKANLPEQFLWFSNILDSDHSKLKNSKVYMFNDSRKLMQQTGKVESSDHTQITLSGLKVTPGDSGGPIFTDKGLVGMLTNTGFDTSTACSIGQIQALFQTWELPWNLHGFHERTDISGSWQFFEREEDMLVSPGGTIEIEKINRGYFSVNTYSLAGLKNGEGYAVYRDNVIHASVQLADGDYTQGIFHLPKTLPKLWTSRSVQMDGELILRTADKRPEVVQARLSFLGKNLILEPWNADLYNPNDPSIQLPKTKAQVELFGSTWRATTLSLLSGTQTHLGTASAREASKWNRGVYIRLNKNNSITVDEDAVPTQEATTFIHQWVAEKKTLELKLYQFSANFLLPLPNTNAQSLSGSSTSNDYTLIKLVRVDPSDINRKASKLSENIGAKPTLYQHHGKSILGNAYAPMSEEEYQRQRDYDWSRGDLTRADNIAQKYGVPAKAIIWLANNIDDPHVEDPTPFDILVYVMAELDDTRGYSYSDHIVTMNDPNFIPMIEETAIKVAGVNKRVVQIYRNGMEFAMLKAALIIQECGRLSMYHHPELWHIANCDFRKFAKISTSDEFIVSSKFKSTK